MKNFLHQRNLDLCRAALSIAQSGALSLTEIADQLMATPAPSYYMSRDYAYSALLRYRRGLMAGKRPLQLARWEALDGDVRRYMEHRRYASLIEAVDYVVNNRPAPGFFLEKVSLVRMLQYMNRRSRLTSRRDLLGVNRLGAKFIRHSPSRA
jgi:hypothetical protein